MRFAEEMLEAANLLRHEVCTFLSRADLPPGATTIAVTMVTAEKTVKGVFVRFKVRICARGDHQRLPADTNTSSPVALPSSFRLAINICVSDETLGAAAVDIGSAYLHAPISVEQHIHFKGKVVDLLVRADANLSHKVEGEGKNRELVAKLEKCLYGLKQAGLDWYNFLSAILIEEGFTCCPRDRGVFVKGNLAEGTLVIICVHVDDMLIVGTKEGRAKIISGLQRRFPVVKVKDDKEEFELLGVTYRKTEDGGFHASLPHMERELVETVLTAEIRAAPTPFQTRSAASARGETLDDCDANDFRSHVAKLLYLSRHARPDIAMAVSELTMHQQDPSTRDREDMRHVVRYLKGTMGQGMRFTPSDLQIRASADAAYAYHHPGSKGHTGGVIWMGEHNAPIQVLCKVQELTVTGSMEAELVAMAAVTQAITRVCEVAEWMGARQRGKVLVEQDNASLILCVGNEGYSGSSKAINMRFDYVMQQIATDYIAMHKVHSEDMLADPLTKRGARGFARWKARILNMKDEDDYGDVDI